jgi:Mce-associated membrane protein
VPHGSNSVLAREAEEAEAEAAEALAAAALARARAARLRERAEALTPEAGAETPEAETDTDSSADEPPSERKRRRLRRPGWATVVAILAVLVTAASLAASGYLTWHHREATRQHQRSGEFAAAARQIAFTLMSIDAAKAEESVKQILDNSTGQFHDEFKTASEDFVKLAQDGKVVTDVKVKAAAVESMTNDSATVLVTATSTVTNAAGADKQPRSWRLSVDIVEDAGQLKMSKMEFVP